MVYWWTGCRIIRYSWSVNSFSRSAPSWGRGIWRMQHPIRQQMDRRNDLTRGLLPDYDTMGQSISKSGTFLCSHSGMRIKPKCSTLQTWGPSSLVLSRHPPDPTTFDAKISLLSDTTVSKSPYILQERLVHRGASMWQDPEKSTKIVHMCSKATTKRSLAMYSKRFTLDSKCKLISHLWKLLRQNHCRLICTVN